MQVWQRLSSESSSSLLPRMRGIAGSALPTVSLLSSFRNFKSEWRFAAIVSGTALVSD